jgi:hypothetical protein
LAGTFEGARNDEDDAGAGFLAAFGFLTSRLLRFWLLAMQVLQL